MLEKLKRLIPIEYSLPAIYLTIGSLWILLSDNIVSSLSNNISSLNNLQHYKGWLFVISTAIALFFIIKKYVKRIRNAEAKAQKNEILKTEFIKNISHELRTPMNAIIGFTELAISIEEGNSETKQYLEIIEKSSKQLLTIVTDVVDTSLLASGNMVVTSNEFVVNTFMKSIYSYFLPLMRNDIQLKLDQQEEREDLILYNDEEKLKRVFHNLINNSIKYTYKGMIRIGYRFEKSNIIFYVEDTGVGIKQHLHEEIIMQFKQIELEMSNRSGGPGLGLSICKEMVELLNGRIWLESQPGKGSKFFFSIPMKSSTKK